MRQALQNRPITVFGDGSQTRSFCYVDDLIRGMIALAESGEVGPINVGNPNEFTLLELAETIIEVTGSKSEIVFEALPTDDPQVRQPDIGLARDAARLGARGRAARRPACGRSSSRGPTSSSARAEVDATGPARTRRTRGTSPEHLPSCRVRSREMPTTQQQPLEGTGKAPEITSAPGFALSDRDVRRKRPPALAFVLKLDTVRKVAAAQRAAARSTTSASTWRS